MLPYRKILTGIFFLAFVLRFGYGVVENVPVAVDARVYQGIALNLMQGLGFAESPEVPRYMDGSIRVVGPAYPIFLGSLFWLFGPHLWIVWMIQAFLGAATCVVFANLGKDAFESKTGVAAAALAALAFDLIIYPGMLLTETLYLFLVAMALLALSRAMRADSLGWALAAGILVGLAALTRPTILLFAALFAMWRAAIRSWRTVVPLLMGIAFMLLPWGARNFLIYGEVILVSPNGGWNFWLGANPEADGSYPNVIPVEIARTLRREPYLQQSRTGYARGMQFIKQHPGQYAKILALKLIKYFSVARTNGWNLHMRGVDRIISIALSASTTLVLLSLGLLGFFRSFGRRDSTLVCLILYAGSCILSGLIYTVHARYRLLIFPALIIFAAHGLYELSRCRSGTGGEPGRWPVEVTFAMSLGIVMLATTIDAITAASEIQRRLALLLGP
ncbi:MAG: hypothetical protein A3H39_14900 [candidate division NC10 bacterium RIFCSPLOWO2_02_FULL_66_22]|nr:MAG: hypothetical protein A3H39_14900 [candidate division NC10 bacterium RIFCSPLOWO2_02_FULL_66_22]